MQREMNRMKLLILNLINRVFCDQSDLKSIATKRSAVVGKQKLIGDSSGKWCYALES